MIQQRDEETQLFAEAIELVLELNAHRDDDAVNTRVDEWTGRSDEHLRVFSRVAEGVKNFRHQASLTRSDAELTADRSPIATPALAHVPQPEFRRRRPALRECAGWAATFLVAASVALCASYYSRLPTEYRTSTESMELTLKDRSTAYLYPNTAIEELRTRHSRTTRVLGGSVYIDVRQDPRRPFFIVSGNTSIQALGTRLNVLYFKGGTSIYLEQGAARVSLKGNSWSMGSGQFAQMFDDGRIDPVSALPTLTDTRKRRVRHRFTNATLLDIVDYFNALDNPLRLHVRGAASLKRISAVVDLTDPRPFVDRLEDIPHLRVAHGDIVATISSN